MHPCLSVISLTCLFATPLLFPNIFRTIQYELSKICWSLLEVIRLRGDSQQTSDRLTLNPTAEICWRWHQVSIWRAIKISSPNLKSFLNQLYKSGYNQTLIRVLTDTQRTPDWHPTDSGLQKEDSRVWGLLSDRHTSNPKTVCLASLITGKLLECYFCFLTLSKFF